MKFLIFFFILTSISFCQSELLDSTSAIGFGVGYTYANNDKSSTNGFDLVVSVLSTIDIGIQSSTGKTEVDYYDDDLKTSSTSVYLAYNFKRKNNAINLKVLLGYYTADIVKSSISSSGVIAGLGFYPRFLDDMNVVLRGALELQYGFLSTQDNNSYYRYDNSEFDNSRSISAGLIINIIPSTNFHMVFEPFVSKDLLHSDNPVYVGINVRLLFSFEKND